MTTDPRANLGAQRLQRETARHRHDWLWNDDGDMCPNCVTPWKCNGPHEGPRRGWRMECSCGAVKDATKSRAGRSASRLGKDTERRLEKLYGPTKVGEYGDAIDLIGRTWKWQSKATRDDVPRWVGRLGEWGPIDAHAWITVPIEAMEPLRRDLRPLLVRSWVHVGVRPVDVIIVRANDWAEEHGGPVPLGEFIAMTGRYFLDVNGRDES
jgi:hypothetical protein